MSVEILGEILFPEELKAEPIAEEKTAVTNAYVINCGQKIMLDDGIHIPFVFYMDVTGRMVRAFADDCPDDVGQLMVPAVMMNAGGVVGTDLNIIYALDYIHQKYYKYSRLSIGQEIVYHACDDHVDVGLENGEGTEVVCIGRCEFACA